MPIDEALQAQETAARFVTELLERGCAQVARCPFPLETVGSLGLRREGDWLVPPSDWDPLDARAIRDALGSLARAWLRGLEVWPAIGSTNAELVRRAHETSIDGHVCMAELQTVGRGRRGRGWFSPLGGSLALSLGFAAPRLPAELGGLSLVVGLAVVDALESAGVVGLALKWPNDILLQGAKLGGILIELSEVRGTFSLVVGVGLNVRLPEDVRRQLDQEVADLASAGAVLPSRSALASRLISSIVEFETGFAATGFEPFAAVFDRRHAYQDAAVSILQGDQCAEGRVLGVMPDGGLRIRTGEGERIVHGGEVSLRQGGVGAGPAGGLSIALPGAFL